MLLSALVSLAVLVPVQDRQVESVWPPIGPKWETDPAVALERARKEAKAIFVYVATES